MSILFAGCQSCAVGSGVGGPLSPSVGPQTPQPSLSPVPAPAESQYQRSNRPIDGGSEAGQNDPGPATDNDSSTYYNAPRLLEPRDRTAARSYYESSKPTVDVWTAVYQGPTTGDATQVSARVRSQADIDADGWNAVSSNR